MGLCLYEYLGLQSVDKMPEASGETLSCVPLGSKHERIPSNQKCSVLPQTKSCPKKKQKKLEPGGGGGGGGGVGWSLQVDHLRMVG